MKSTYRIVWSSRAAENLKKLYLYLEENWSDKEIKNFSTRLNNFLSLIQQKPKIFLVTEKKLNIRRAVITKHNTLYYRIVGNSIHILTLFDNRQNPQKRKI